VSNLLNFVDRIKGFHDRPTVFKIEVFSWFLHQIQQRERFQASDLLPCFDQVHVQRPGNIYSQLAVLCAKKPPRLLKDSAGYRLSATSRQEMQATLPLRESSVAVTVLLSELSAKVNSPSQQSFLAETMTCYAHGAYRAAVVMAWNLAYSYVCDRIYADACPAFNTQLTKVIPKAAPISKRSDFEDLKESRVLEVARGAGILSASTFKVLKEKLDKRNLAAHPSLTTLSAVTAEEVIHDLVENVVLKTSF
jgi:hypothetical protein